MKWTYKIGAVAEIDDQDKQVHYFVTRWGYDTDTETYKKCRRHAGTIDIPISADPETEVLSALLEAGYEQSQLSVE